MNPPPGPAPLVAREHADDDALMVAIAKRRSREAFETVYGRYHFAAYNLALHITGRPDLAEEAVQNAMSRVWRLAATYRGGNLRSWLLRVVANASMVARRTQRRHEIKTASGARRAPANIESQPSASLERSELLDVLRRNLSQLNQNEQVLVALYFGAGMTQAECARELDLTQRTVSDRIRNILGELRTRLTQAGFAAAIPLVESGALADIVCSGYPPPAGMKERVLENLAHAAQNSVRSTMQIGFAGKCLLLVAAITMASAAGTVWWVQTQRQPMSRQVSPLAPDALDDGETPVTRFLDANTPHSALLAKWTFEKGPAEDLTVFQGRLQWEKLKDGGVMRTSENDLVCVLLPLKFEPRPFSIELTLSPCWKGCHSFDLVWVDEEGAQPYFYNATFLSGPTVTRADT